MQLMKIYVSKDTLRQIFHNIYLLIYLFMFTEGNSVSICPHISNHDILLQEVAHVLSVVFRNILLDDVFTRGCGDMWTFLLKK